MLAASELKALLKAHGLQLTKRLGQHHLVDARAIERIVEACALTPQDRVIEIGAGLGALTEPLARRADRVVAVEVDRGICALLRQRMRPHPNVSVECRDILTFTAQEVRGAVAVGAIPYHITSQILVWLSEVRHALRKAVLVIQREVAARLAAAPGTKVYGRLSLLAQYGWQVRELFPVSRSAFFPRPDVDSRCLALLPRSAAPVRVSDERALFALVKAAFSQRRKTLANCLRGLILPNGAGGSRVQLTQAEIAGALDQLRLKPSARGETLSLEQFAALTELLLHK